MTTRFVHEMRVAPGSSPGLDQRKADIRPRGLDKKQELDRLADRVESLGVQHARLAAEGTRAVLLILQGLAELLVETLERLDPQLPSADPALDGIEIV